MKPGSYSIPGKDRGCDPRISSRKTRPVLFLRRVCFHPAINLKVQTVRRRSVVHRSKSKTVSGICENPQLQGLKRPKKPYWGDPSYVHLSHNQIVHPLLTYDKYQAPLLEHSKANHTMAEHATREGVPILGVA